MAPQKQMNQGDGGQADLQFDPEPTGVSRGCRSLSEVRGVTELLCRDCDLKHRRDHRDRIADGDRAALDDRAEHARAPVGRELLAQAGSDAVH
jgi:hypothetical protein